MMNRLITSFNHILHLPTSTGYQAPVFIPPPRLLLLFPHLSSSLSPHPPRADETNSTLEMRGIGSEKGEQERGEEAGFTVSSLATSPCILIATKNVVGRYINRVERWEVCWKGASAGWDGTSLCSPSPFLQPLSPVFRLHS
ncbi:hypothetical protein BJ165DRAFT_667189 [Panaeolus papilionaceus]|nr:hypothetical protein BJ165DRAFT_667189 [Panaeolus papilionaceus]